MHIRYLIRIRSMLDFKTASTIATPVVHFIAGVAALAGISFQTFLAVALLIVGVAMLIGSRRGRARGLLVVGLLLAAAATAASVADVSLAGGTGDRTFAPVRP